MGAVFKVLIAVVALAPSLDAGSAESDVGIVLMHGKWAGHAPDLQAFGASVARARQMIAAGKAEETAPFDDSNQGQNRTINTTARIYLPYFDSEGLGVMPKSAAAIPGPVPFLWAVGRRDGIFRHGESYVFSKVPKHASNKYLVVDADHAGTTAAAAPQIVEWIMSLGY